jgi:hypothetical protein
MTAALRPPPVIAIPETRSTLRLEFVLLAVPLALLAVVALLPGLIAPSLDAAVFTLVGERLAAGEIPYVQVFDHKPPGLYLLIGLGQWMTGQLGAWHVSWLLSAGAAALTGVLVADTLRVIGWRRLAWLCGGLCTAILASFPLALGGGLGETVAVLPAMIAVRLLAVGDIGSPPRPSSPFRPSRQRSPSWCLPQCAATMISARSTNGSSAWPGSWWVRRRSRQGCCCCSAQREQPAQPSRR